MSVQDSTFKTTHVMDNEIVKANDFEFAFEQIVENVSKATQMILESNQDFVINGKVLPDTGMNVRVSPIYGVCKSTGIPFGRTEATDETIGFEGSSSGRRDILEVQGDWESYDNQQRAFNDPETDTKTYQYVDTKKLMKPIYRVKKGTDGSSTAPEVDEGWVKLAEVQIRAGASSIIASDILNITADIAGVNNTGWTTQKAITYNIGYITDINERFRVQHNADGTHKDNVINTDSLDIGTGAKQINGNVLPLGGNTSLPTEDIAASDSIYTAITRVVTCITSIYNAYMKYGSFNFYGKLSISDAALNHPEGLIKPITIEADGSGNAYIKIDGTTALTINSAGKLTTNGYSASSANDIVTKAVTDAITTSLNALANRVTNLETTVAGNYVYINKTLSNERFVIDYVSIIVATTENITLSGSQTVDGVTLQNNQYVLVKNQTDAKQNGIYYVSTNSSWVRVTAYNTPNKLKGKIFNISSGTTNGGKMFYIPNETFTAGGAFGTDTINFAEYFGSVAAKSGKAVIRNSDGKVEGNITGDSASCSGNAATASSAAKWTTARNISISDSDGTNTGTAVSVDGSANKTLKLPSTIKATLTGNASTATSATSATNATNSTNVNVGNKTDNVDYPLVFAANATAGNKRIYTDDTISHAKYNPSSNTLEISGNVKGSNLPNVSSVYSSYTYNSGYFLLAQLTSANVAANHDIGFSGVVYEDKGGTTKKAQFRLYARGNKQSIATTVFSVIGTADLKATYQAIDTNTFVLRLYGTISANYQRFTTFIDYATSGDVSVRVSNTTVTLPGTQAASVTGTEITKTNELTKSDVGLGNVDNTADANKSVNYATSSGSCSGNAATATSAGKWTTARDIKIQDADGTNTGSAVSVDGSAAKTLKLPSTIKASITGNCSGSSGSCTGNAATATSAGMWTTARKLNGVAINGSEDKTNYCTCSTAASTVAKEVTLAGFSLETGAEITIKFTVTNTANNPTLKVKYDGTNFTTAKPIYYRGAAITAGYLAANRTYTFRYNGTQFELVGDINTNTTYSTVSKTAAGLCPQLPNETTTTKYLRQDGSWVAPPNTTYSTVSKTAAGLCPQLPDETTTTKYLRQDGSWVVPPNTTYNNATQSAAGLMSSTDKTKLDGIAAGAQVNTITGVKGNSESSYRIGNVNITASNIGLGNVDNKSYRETGFTGLYCDINKSQQTGASVKYEPTGLGGSGTFATGSVVRITFKYALRSSVNITSVSLNYGGCDGEIQVNKAGELKPVQSHVFNGGNYTGTYNKVVWDAYTTLELMWNGSVWIVMGNPVLCSYFSETQSYTVYANGLIEQFGEVDSSHRSIIFGPSFSNTKYTVVLGTTHGGGENAYYYDKSTNSMYVNISGKYNDISYLCKGY